MELNRKFGNCLFKNFITILCHEIWRKKKSYFVPIETECLRGQWEAPALPPPVMWWDVTTPFIFRQTEQQWTLSSSCSSCSSFSSFSPGGSWRWLALCWHFPVWKSLTRCSDNIELDSLSILAQRICEGLLLAWHLSFVVFNEFYIINVINACFYGKSLSLF